MTVDERKKTGNKRQIRCYGVENYGYIRCTGKESIFHKILYFNTTISPLVLTSAVGCYK